MSTAPSPAAPLPVVERTLKLYASLTQQALRTYLPDKEPRRHLYSLLPEYPLRGGKGLRPALCLASCRAFGGSLAQALESAVALELLHNAFLIHDDIADGSTRRRGGPALHELYNVPLALNAGDALAFLSMRPLCETVLPQHRHSVATFAMFEEAVSQTLEGQAIELGWTFDNEVDLSVGDYLVMTLKKTGWYTAIHPCRVGAHIGSRGRADPARFLRYGFFLGAVFQLRDDLLGFEGDGLNNGAGEDLFEGKRTLMLIHLLHEDGPDRPFVHAFVTKERARRTPEEVARIMDMMQAHGSIAYSERWLHSLAARADAEFDVAFEEAPDSEHKRFLRGIVPYLLSPRASA